MFGYNRQRTLNKKRRLEKKIRKAKENRVDNGKPYLTLFTGAGVSQESGISTFRASDGLWNNHSVHEVATPAAYKRDPEFVTQFYNERRKDIYNAEPNEAHKLIAELEEHFNVTVVTQNIDNLHERAGSSNVLHLHGEITKLQNVANPNKVHELPEGTVEVDYDLRDEKTNSRLRPHVVFFGERPLNITEAEHAFMKSDYVVVVGTSLQVQPAASLLDYAPKDAKLFIVNPDKTDVEHPNVEHFETVATEGMKKFVQEYLDKKRK